MRRTRWLPALGLLACTGCGEDFPPPSNSVRVAVSTDAMIPDELDGLSINVTRGGVTRLSMTYDEAVVAGLPDVLLLENAEPLDDTGNPITTPVTVTVQGLLAEAPVIVRTATFTFTNREPKMLYMRLCASCAMASCDAGQTCTDAGVCTDEGIDVESLPKDDGTLSLVGPECPE